MKLKEKFKPVLEGVVQSMGRFPLTTLFLFLLAATDAWMIEKETGRLEMWMGALVVGAFLSALAEMIHERFFQTNAPRFALQAGSVAGALVYYFLSRPYTTFYLPLTTRTSIFLAAAAIAFFWVPTIRSRVYFHENLLIGLKAYFLSSLYALVFASGMSSLLFAISNLLVRLSFNVYLHVWNVTFILLAPLVFLSFIPYYPGRQEEKKSLETRERHAHRLYSAISAPRSLEILMTYIVIPLIVVYTLVLMMYFVTNLNQKFWTDPVLEPLLLSYSIVGVWIYLIVCNIHNATAEIFRKIFPKLIVLVMAFQLYASFRRMQEIGLTHGRYFVLLTGIAVLLIGLLFSFSVPKKTGWAAILALVASVIAMTPPVDGFTVGRNYHRRMLENVLVKNEMLKDGIITSNPNISEKDREKISRAVEYLEDIGDLDKVAGVHSKDLSGKEFETLFGFSEQKYPEEDPNYEPLEEDPAFYSDASLDLDVSGFHYFIELHDYGASDDLLADKEVVFVANGKEYTLETEGTAKEGQTLIIKEQGGAVLESIDLNKLYEEKLEGVTGTEYADHLDDATIDVENDAALVRVIFRSLTLYNDRGYAADFYVLIQIK